MYVYRERAVRTFLYLGNMDADVCVLFTVTSSGVYTGGCTKQQIRVGNEDL